MINKIHIENYKIFEAFDLIFNNDLNIIVGDNEAGKSTILEAINLALTKKINGKPIDFELSPYFFNKKCVENYIKQLNDGKNPELPKIIIELYLSSNPELEFLKGSNNTDKTNSIGVKLEIIFNNDFADEYSKLVEDPAQVKVIPTEYYKVNWYSFANNAVNVRTLPVGLSYIDATAIRLQSGTDYYLQDIINNGLDLKEKIALSIAYRGLKEKFSAEPSIQGINDKLTQKRGAITNKKLAISIDISQKSNWENNLIPHLDELPFQLIGKGEQSALKIMLALERQAENAHIILIEEPENHLSFSSMNILISKIKNKCENKQIFITTHSAYVLNKLGIEKLILVNHENTLFLKNLPESTQKYFRILSGYDTLRLILAKKSILVEGPSDELIVQKAYFTKNKKLPIEDGIDIINVRGLSFSRFLDIAKELKKSVTIITDNDGDYKKNVIEKYKTYTTEGSVIKVCSSDNNDLNTLEPNIIDCNSIGLLNKILEKKYPDIESLKEYMKYNKTECALKIFETKEDIKIPKYIEDAIA